LSLTFATGSTNPAWPSTTGQVKGNKPGPNGEYRAGAFLVQAVLVNADGTPAFTTNPAISNGGVQGPAVTGLLWEMSVFYHAK
jgi:hypothetical protein